jgi:hypothetical protein
MEASDPLWDTVAAMIKRGRGRTQVRWRPTWENVDVHWVPDVIAAHDQEDAGDARAGDAGGANVQQGDGDGGAEARASDGGLLDRSTRGSRKIRTSLVAFLSSSSRSRRTVPPGPVSSTPSPAVAAAVVCNDSEAGPAVLSLGSSSPPTTRTGIGTSRRSSRSSDEVSASLEPSGPLPPAVPYLKRSSKRRRHTDPAGTASSVIISSSNSSSSRQKKLKHAPSEFLVPSPPPLHAPAPLRRS